MANTPATIKVDVETNLETEINKLTERVGHNLRLFAAAMEIVEESGRQVEKFGIQHHRDGTGKGYGSDMLVDLDRFGVDSTNVVADVARIRADHYAGLNGGNALEWEQILTEEFFEALEESGWPALRKELLQVAAVALSWVVDGDTRTHDEEID